MNAEEKERIKDLQKCDFQSLADYFAAEAEKRKALTKEEKIVIKEAKEAEARIYGWAMVDGHKQKVGNFRIEPPGLFRGRGDHPKMGMLKHRVHPESVSINCSKDSEVPQPPDGHKWKEVRHDNTVTWLCTWTENVQSQNKYVMLNPSSKLKASGGGRKRAKLFLFIFLKLNMSFLGRKRFCEVRNGAQTQRHHR